MNKTQAISAMILAKVETGMSVRDAFDAVLGAGRYDELAGNLYDALTA